jgi:hypothetical protein
VRCQSDFSGNDLRPGAAGSFKVEALFDRCLAGAALEQSRAKSAAAISIADLQSSAFWRKVEFTTLE